MTGKNLLTDADIEKGWHATFSTSNPYRPCNLKTFTKAVRWAEAVLSRLPAASPKDSEGLTIADYEEVLADHRRLVRELDVALNGEEGAAPQASLCDIVRQVKDRNWPKIVCASSSGDKVYRATVELNGVLTYMTAASEAGAVPAELTYGLILKHLGRKAADLLCVTRWKDGIDTQEPVSGLADLIAACAAPSPAQQEPLNEQGDERDDGDMLTIAYMSGRCDERKYQEARAALSKPATVAHGDERAAFDIDEIRCLALDYADHRVMALQGKASESDVANAYADLMAALSRQPPAPASAGDERKAFERAYHARYGVDMTRHGDEYKNVTQSACWKLWQARAALPASADDLIRAYDAGFDDSGEGWNGEHPGFFSDRERESYEKQRAESLAALAAAKKGDSDA